MVLMLEFFAVIVRFNQRQRTHLVEQQQAGERFCFNLRHFNARPKMVISLSSLALQQMMASVL